jgi:hypothetical protein
MPLAFAVDPGRRPLSSQTRADSLVAPAAGRVPPKHVKPYTMKAALTPHGHVVDLLIGVRSTLD